MQSGNHGPVLKLGVPLVFARIAYHWVSTTCLHIGRVIFLICRAAVLSGKELQAIGTTCAPGGRRAFHVADNRSQLGGRMPPGDAAP